MFAGVGVIGALASILASILVPSPKEDEPAVATDRTVQEELIDIKAELAALRLSLSGGSDPRPG